MIINMDLRDLVEHGLSPNEYVYLYSIAFNITEDLEEDLLLSVDTFKLMTEGFYREVNDENGIRVPELLKKGAALVGALRREKTIKSEYEVNNVPNWVDEYRKLWPATSPSGRLLRANSKATTKKLQSFIKKQSGEDLVITKDLIMKAAKHYLAGQHKDRYTYTKQCDHFVWKDNEMNSTLRTWIDLIIEDPVSLETNTDMTDDI